MLSVGKKAEELFKIQKRIYNAFSVGKIDFLRFALYSQMRLEISFNHCDVCSPALALVKVYQRFCVVKHCCHSWLRTHVQKSRRSSCSPAWSSTMSWVVSVSNYCGWERRFCIPKTHNCNIEHNSSSSYFTIWDNVVWYLPIFLRDCHDRLMMTFYLEKPTKIVKHKGNLLWKLLNEEFFFPSEFCRLANQAYHTSDNNFIFLSFC